MPRPIIFFVNGIRTNPGDPFGWTDRAVSWVHRHTEMRAEKFEYFTPAVLRWIHQKKRAENLLACALPYLEDGSEVHLVGHSNGADLVLRVLRMTTIPISSVHLIAAATEADCRRNGINRAYRDAMLAHASCYCSELDRALRLASWSRSLLGWAGMGYGDLGRVGPKYLTVGANGITRTVWKPFHHSQWFEGAQFDDTMRMIAEVAA